MKFVAVEDISAPIETVWAKVSDFDGFQRRVSARAGDIRRTPDGPVSQGTTWSGRATFNGKTRDVTVVVMELSGPVSMALEGGTDGMTITVEIALEALSARATRLTVTSQAKARTLAARLMLQSAKLARQTLAKRYKGRVAAFAESVEKNAKA
ncbi:MAG: SRPBCC family protein [Jannaschia sp.]